MTNDDNKDHRTAQSPKHMRKKEVILQRQSIGYAITGLNQIYVKGLLKFTVLMEES